MKKDVNEDIKKDNVLFEDHSLEYSDVIKKLDSSVDGLSEDEAGSRLEKDGYNTLTSIEESNIVIEFLSHFWNPLIIILLVAASISWYFGEHIDATIISIMVLLSVTLDFFEEYSANKSAKKLAEKVETTATVIRDGEKKDIKAKDICKGDIIFLSSGDMIPADARVISSKDFFVNQSALTGESYPCEKTEQVIANRNVTINEMTNIVFSGTNVISGSATAIVIRTGKNTEFGKIAQSLAKAPEKSEFEHGITNFGYLIMKIMFFLVILIFLFNAVFKHDILQAFLFSIAVAVGVTPELLPIIMSVTMSKGSMNMAKKGVIVKKLVSIPNFGSMDVLCTDKTGTLTEDHITLVKYTDVSGADSSPVLEHAYLNSAFQTGLRNPLDDAVLEYKKINTDDYKKIDEIPFDFIRKRMSIIVEKKDKDGNFSKDNVYMITKGAPEEIFKCAIAYSTNEGPKPLDDHAKENAISKYHELSAEGYRVIAIATRKITEHKEIYNKDDEKDLELMGFVSFLDPAKKDIKHVLEELHEIGVEVKVITGDNEFVTKKICHDIGLEIKGVMLGSEIDTMTDDALKTRSEKTTIFARFSPEQKNRIIHVLKSNGHVVGYMGDGINDAPSLKAADVGISVNNAVDVAKESAEVVLTHKSLEVLKEGIIEGRKSFGNTMKYIMMGLSSNFGNMFSAAGAVIFLPFLPMLPIQILLNNFIYDFSQITIPSDNVDKDWINKPKRWNLRFIKKFMYIFGPISSLFDFITFFILFFVMHASAGVFQTGWFIESLATQTLIIHFIRTKKTPFVDSMPSIYLLISTIVCVAVGWIIPITPVGKFFGFEPLPWFMYLAIIGIVISYFIVVEIVKRIFYKNNEF